MHNFEKLVNFLSDHDVWFSTCRGKSLNSSKPFCHRFFTASQKLNYEVLCLHLHKTNYTFCAKTQAIDLKPTAHSAARKISPAKVKIVDRHCTYKQQEQYVHAAADSVRPAGYIVTDIGPTAAANFRFIALRNWPVRACLRLRARTP